MYPFHKTIATFECEVITKKFHLVGQSITTNYPGGFPDAAIKVQTEFESRRDEIKNVVNKEILYSPHMCNEIFATYFACLEVEEIEDVPEGMTGFTLPATKYAKISCSNNTIDEGYTKIFAWMDEKEYVQKWFHYSCPIEIYYLDENVDEEVAEILIPLE
ncbi:GyrI-like domain-containing protein [Radiobacillus deserti]|uniref:AraC family transcriptional regulator n=1 Tax=Radiobacillus deserti TaxID=2594883 RepID=A0A516KDI1_9BACI|nr:effector binding domain-containing protein [Radiobacillus deserti]QDP39474.1 AraC family transcriptional regulator [Radiobacillus deserti]